MADQITTSTIDKSKQMKKIIKSNSTNFYSSSSAIASQNVTIKPVASSGKVTAQKTNSVPSIIIVPEKKTTVASSSSAVAAPSPSSAITPKILNNDSKLSPKWKYVSANATTSSPNSTAAPVYPQSTSTTKNNYQPYQSPHGLKYKTNSSQFATTTTPPSHSYVPSTSTTNNSTSCPTNGGYSTQKSFKQNQFFRVSGEVKKVANPLTAARPPPVSVATTTTLSHLPSLKIRFPRAKQKDVPFHLLKVGAPVDTPMPLHAVNFSKEWSFTNLTNYIRKLPEGMIEAWEVKGCDAKDFIGPFFKFYGDRKVVACCKLPNGDIIWAIPPSARDTLQCLKNKISCEFDGRGYIVITHSKKM